MTHLETLPPAGPEGKLSARAIIISFLQEQKLKSKLKAEQERRIVEFLMETGNEDYCAAVLYAYLGITLNATLEEAFPAAPEVSRARAAVQIAERKQKAQERTIIYEREKAIAKAHMDELTLDTLICGKKLRDCTGTEIAKLGGLFARLGKMVGRKKFGKFFEDDEAFKKAAKK